jgi:hypothetical protein
MSSRKNLGRVGIPKNVEISLIDLAPIACYKLQDIRALHLRSTFFSPEKPGLWARSEMFGSAEIN